MSVTGTLHAPSTGALAGERPPRRTDLDGLRILICASIIVAHALLIFAAEPRYHLKSAEPSFVASVLYEFMRATTMALFFTIAGWSAVESLRRRSASRFVHERVERLLVPMLVGTALFGSVIKYIELRNGRDIGLAGFRLVEPWHGGFLDFFPYNLLRIKQITWSHLWFLAYLFVMSVVLVAPLMRLARMTPRTAVPAAPLVYVPGLVLALWVIGSNGYWPFLPNLITDWANFGLFALCFSAGAGMAAWPGFETRLRAEAPRMLLLLIVSFAGLVWFGESAAGRLFVGLTAWGAIGAGLGYAYRVRPRTAPIFAYLSEATLPIYIMHHAPLLVLGWYLLPLDIPIALKIVLMSLGTAVVSLAVYHWLIRPWPPTRWMTGMMRLRPG